MVMLPATFASVVFGQFETSTRSNRGSFWSDSAGQGLRVEGTCSWNLDAPDLPKCLDRLAFEKIFSDNGNNPEQNSIAGAVIAVVHNDAITVRGYGCADAASGRAVIASADLQEKKNTLFRAGSISKLVTATAVMQVVESTDPARRLDLDEDVNTYLDFTLPAHGSGKITLRNLLTHTAGFEENQVGMVQRAGGRLVELEAFLKAHVPARARPATRDFSDGREASYSSWGMALAGYIVARQAGMTFEKYAEKNIFDRLGMTDSTFHEPGQDGWREFWNQTLAYGHAHKPAGRSVVPAYRDAPQSIPCPPHANGRFVPQEFEHLTAISPAGGLNASAADMARFMGAHLNGGRWAGRQILTKDSVEQMQRFSEEYGRLLVPPQFPHDFAAAGLAFQQEYRNKHRILVHTGGTPSFSAILMLIPEKKTGLFMAVNSNPENAYLLQNTAQAFLHRFVEKNPLLTDPYEPGSAERYAGTYISNPHAYSTNEKFFLYADPESTIKVEYAPETQTLLISNLHVDWSHWLQVGPGRFRWVGLQDDGSLKQLQKLIEFDDSAGVTRILGPDVFAPAYKLALYQTPAFHRSLLGLCWLAFMLALVWPVVSFGAATAPGPVLARRLAAALALGNLVALALLLREFSKPYELLYGYPGAVYVAVTLLLLSLLLTAGVVVSAIRAWACGWWSGVERFSYTLFALMALAFLWSMNHWNLIGYKFS